MMENKLNSKAISVIIKSIVSCTMFIVFFVHNDKSFLIFFELAFNYNEVQIKKNKRYINVLRTK